MNSGNVSNEVRGARRDRFLELATLTVPQGGTYLARTENLSTGGAYLISERQLPPGTEGLLTMMLRVDGRRCQVTSRFRVVHDLPSPSGGAGMGIEFLEMDDESRAMISSLLGEG